MEPDIFNSSLDNFNFHSKYLALDDSNKLHYIDEGIGNETILFVHGNPTWSFYYRHLINHFKQSYRTVALDHLGMGLSSRPLNFEYTLENRINNLVYFIDRMNLKNINLVVHDWGGPIGIGALLKRYDLFKSLVISNTAAFNLPLIPKRIALGRTPFLGKYLIENQNMFAKMAIKMCVKRNKMPDSIKKGYLFPYNKSDSRKAIYEFVQDIPLKNTDRSYKTVKNIENQLSKIKIPKLLLWGGKDFCFHDAFYNEWKQIYNGIESHYFEDTGHYLFEESTDLIIPIISKFYGKLH